MAERAEKRLHKSREAEKQRSRAEGKEQRASAHGLNTG